MSTEATTTATAQVVSALDGAAQTLKRSMAAERRAIREIRQAQAAVEAEGLGMRLQIEDTHDRAEEAQSDERSESP